MRDDLIYKIAQMDMGSLFNPSKRCIRCDRIAHDNCYSLRGHREVAISSLCESCFDVIMDIDDEEP